MSASLYTPENVAAVAQFIARSANGRPTANTNNKRLFNIAHTLKQNMQILAEQKAKAKKNKKAFREVSKMLHDLPNNLNRNSQGYKALENVVLVLNNQGLMS